MPCPCVPAMSHVHSSRPGAWSTAKSRNKMAPLSSCQMLLQTKFKGGCATISDDFREISLWVRLLYKIEVEARLEAHVSSQLATQPKG
eukprot:s1188_g8.t1